MSLMELFTLLTVILMLLSLILDAVRLTVEVLEKFSQRKCDDNKKDCLPQPSNSVQSILIVKVGS